MFFRRGSKKPETLASSTSSLPTVKTVSDNNKSKKANYETSKSPQPPTKPQEILKSKESSQPQVISESKNSSQPQETTTIVENDLGND
jgi:hypothetical protein